MPGINLLCKDTHYPEILLSKFDKIQNKMKHESSYYSKILLVNDEYILGFTGYNEYPINLYKNDTFTIVLEGKIYNKSEKELEEDLFDIAHDMSNHLDIGDVNLKSWLLKADGEFIILIFDK